jgi:DNA-binding PadR family transcriptional regulator
MPIGLPSGKETVVLRLLRDEPSGKYGLELVKASNGKLGQASVYVTLARMETKGFVKSHTPLQDEHPGLPRPHYTITALGERALKAVDAVHEVMSARLAMVPA